MKSMVAMIGLALGLFSASTFAAACPLPKGTVDIHVKNAQIADVLSFVFTEAKMEYELIDNPALHKTVSLNVRDAELCSVFDFAMSEAKLNYKIRVQAEP